MAAFTEEQKRNFHMSDWYDLSGKTAVVTGGASGLGLAITRCLVSSGAKVIVLSGRTPEEAEKTLAEFDGRTVFYQFNISDTDRTQSLVDQIISEQGPIDILVNNAGNHCKKVSVKSPCARKPAARGRPGSGLKIIMPCRYAERSKASEPAQHPVESDPSLVRRIRAMSGSGRGLIHSQRRFG